MQVLLNPQILQSFEEVLLRLRRMKVSGITWSTDAKAYPCSKSHLHHAVAGLTLYLSTILITTFLAAVRSLKISTMVCLMHFSKNNLS